MPGINRVYLFVFCCVLCEVTKTRIRSNDPHFRGVSKGEGNGIGGFGMWGAGLGVVKKGCFAFYCQSFLISKLQSHFRCSFLSSSVNREVTEYVPRAIIPDGASSNGVV